VFVCLPSCVTAAKSISYLQEIGQVYSCFIVAVLYRLKSVCFDPILFPVNFNIGLASKLVSSIVKLNFLAKF
jgi:hypothetical protein